MDKEKCTIANARTSTAYSAYLHSFITAILSQINRVYDVDGIITIKK